jgi:hypothetical protein
VDAEANDSAIGLDAADPGDEPGIFNAGGGRSSNVEDDTRPRTDLDDSELDLIVSEVVRGGGIGLTSSKSMSLTCIRFTLLLLGLTPCPLRPLLLL